jgi:hypothetical protein
MTPKFHVVNVGNYDEVVNAIMIDFFAATIFM